jgi:uncharacterized protein YfkK (UPF0435 family)
MSRHEQGIGQIRELARRAEQRLRLVRVLGVGAQALCGALIAAIVAVACRKVGVISEPAARVLLATDALAFVGVLVGAWAWPLPEHAGARTLDRFHALHDRLASALVFAGVAEPTPFMRAAIEDAVRVAPEAKPRLAVPFRWPRSAATAGGLACALALVGLFEVRQHVALVNAAVLEPVDMAADDLDDVKDFLKQIQQRDSSDETKASIEEFNRLVDDIASHRLDRAEAFRRMEALEEKLAPHATADRKALEERVEAMGHELEKAEMTRPAGKALAGAKLDEARDALQQLAKKFKQAEKTPVDKARLEQTREALKKAAEEAEKRAHELQQRRDELADEILKKKQQMGDGGSDEEQSLLAKKERELERLDRDLDAHRDPQRQLDRLDRDLEKAAEDLMNDLGLSASDLEQSAEDLNRMQEGQATDQQKEELRQKLQELRELMRQQGGGGKGQVIRLKRFGRVARGQGGSSGGEQGEPGEGQQSGQGNGQQGNQGQGQGQQGQGQGQGQQKQGQGQGGGRGGGSGAGSQGGETWVLGPNGEKMLMLSRGQGSGSGQGGGGQEGPGQPGKWGEGHDPNVQGAATHPSMGTQDTQVQGSDSAQGASRSQIILGAAQRGFASSAYKKVYTEYHQVAEESLAKDDVPGGYRFYVKRYFQLIRPRDLQ